MPGNSLCLVLYSKLPRKIHIKFLLENVLLLAKIISCTWQRQSKWAFRRRGVIRHGVEAISLAPQMDSSGSTKLTKGGAQVFALAPSTQAVLGPHPPTELANRGVCLIRSGPTTLPTC